MILCRNHLIPTGCLLLACCLVLPSSGAGAQTSFEEDFSGTAYRDPVLTTADWDTTTQQVQPFSFTPGTVAVEPLGAPGLFVTHRDGYAFVGTDGAGLLVYDITDPTNPSPASSYGGTARVEDLALDGDLGVGATGGGELLTLDLSDPAASVPGSASSIAGESHDIEIVDETWYVAAGSAGLQIIEGLSGIVGTYDPADPVLDVEIRGDLAYLALGPGGLTILDVSDPAAIALVRGFPGLLDAVDVEVEGDVVYLALAGGSLYTISDPLGSSVLGVEGLPGTPADLKIAGDRAFVACGAGGVAVIDISDPAAPTLLRTLDAGDARSVSVLDHRLLVADAGGNLRVEEWGASAGADHRGETASILSGSDLARVGDVAWVAAEGSGVAAVDLSDPYAPTVLSILPVSSFARGIDVSGDHAFVCDINDGLLVVDISDPANPAAVTTFGVSGSTRKVDVVGDTAFVTGQVGAGNPCLYIIDVSDPTAPFLLSTYQRSNTFAFFEGVIVRQRTAYIAAEGAGVFVVSVNPLTLPSEVDQIPTSGSVEALALEGRHLYTASDGWGLEVFDVQTRAKLGDVPFGGSHQAVTVRGRRVFLGFGSAVQVLDAADPAAPLPLHNGYMGVNPDALITDGARLYVAGSSRFVVADLVSDLHDPGTLTAVSRAVDGGDQGIAAVRLEADTAGDVFFNIRAGAGAAFASPGGDWVYFNDPGSDLRWYGYLGLGAPETPTISRVFLEWRLQAARIAAITDVPDDQGGWARLRFVRSGYDHAGSNVDLLGYNVHRRIDDAALATRVVEEGEAMEAAAPTAPDGPRPELSAELGALYRYQDAWYVRVEQPLRSKARQESTATAPPGIWEVVATVFPTFSDEYIALVPTLADSTGGTAPTVYYVSAHASTPGEFYASLPDSGWSVDNIAPAVPTAFSVHYGAAGNQLSWNPAPESDFQYHRIYRSTEAGFTPSEANLVQATATNGWTDPVADPWDQHYLVTTVDDAGNESPPASPGTVTGAGAGPPRRLSLAPATPNPFNPVTRLRFTLPHEGHLTLTVYDAAGRRVRTLVDEVRAAGEHAVTWRGRDDRGRSVASGAYLVRLSHEDGTRTRRVTLVR